jgi:hypothetical protein
MMLSEAAAAATFGLINSLGQLGEFALETTRLVFSTIERSREQPALRS